MNIYKNLIITPTCYTFRYQLLKRCLSSKNGDNEINKIVNLKNKHEVKKTDEDPLKYNRDNKKSMDAQESKEAAKKKLLNLLSELKVEGVPKKSFSNLNLSKPLQRPSKKERFQNLMKEKLSPESKLKLAVKAVASSLPGDSEKTEEELTEKLNTLSTNKASTLHQSRLGKDKITDTKTKDFMSSVEDIASSVPYGDSSPKSKITSRLIRFSLENKGSFQRKSVDSLTNNMKIGKSSSQNEVMKRTGLTSVTPRQQPKFNLFMSPPLNVFIEESTVISEKTIWDNLQERNIELLVEYAPESAFDEMIMWTKEGKHWKFPIDNETEMGDEENIGFHEHVFLEKHLHGFPTKGPVLHFMELVCVGLSKNPYITVERKIENINWFRDYFKQKDKHEILQGYGVL